MFDFIKNNPLTFIVILVLITVPGLFAGAVKFIAFIVLTVIVLMLVLGFIFRTKLRNLQRQMEEQMRGSQSGRSSTGGFYQNFTSQRSEPKGREEGEVKIVKNNQTNQKRVSNQVGDYVDFEDIKEK